MDVYLSRESLQTVAALSLIASGTDSDGLLIGHKRGHRFFVEKILPSMKGFFPSLEKYQQLDELYKGKLLGFFSVKPEERKIKKILAPFACGKLFLELDFSRPKTVSAKSYVINYDRKFFLSPLKTKHSK